MSKKDYQTLEEENNSESQENELFQKVNLDENNIIYPNLDENNKVSRSGSGSESETESDSSPEKTLKELDGDDRNENKNVPDQNRDFIPQDPNEYFEWLKARAYTMEYGKWFKEAKAIYKDNWKPLTKIFLVIFLVLFFSSLFVGLITKALMGEEEVKHSEGSSEYRTYSKYWNGGSVIFLMIGLIGISFLSTYFVIGSFFICFKLIQNNLQPKKDDQIDDNKNENANENGNERVDEKIKVKDVFAGFKYGNKTFWGVFGIICIDLLVSILFNLVFTVVFNLLAIYITVILTYSIPFYLQNNAHFSVKKSIKISRMLTHRNFVGVLCIHIIISFILFVGCLLFGVGVIAAAPIAFLFYIISYIGIFGNKDIPLSQDLIITDRKNQQEEIDL
ncbi:membrane protein-related [Anaeramoeba flamelloides]|uniref:Membrane protein-related n=1 Tax=Anaeramoeba flamelloides TaxID=1746091 RepID=A0AAV7Z292_9EUKA|nr:membrane protein-related [Anaeramoeba flamelloides]